MAKATLGGTLPNFLIIGAQRSGTTSLARYLETHPEVFMASEKEVHFFDRHRSEGINWYRKQFSSASLPAIGEATPEYMYETGIPTEMAKVVPRARLIATLRNPVDRAYSEYWFVRGRGYESLSFADAVAAEPDRLAQGASHERGRYAYLDRGRYFTQLTRVLAHYPRSQLRLVLFEEFRADPVGACRSICRFLEVDDGFVPPNIGSRFGRSRTYHSLGLRRLARRLPYPLGGALSRLNTRRTTYPPMDPSLRARLLEHFRVENEALAESFDLDLSAWNK